PELHHRAAHVPFRGVLLDPLAAAVLAAAVAFQSVLLYDRRVSLRLFRALRRRPVALARHRRDVRHRARADRAGTPATRLEAATLTRFAPVPFPSPHAPIMVTAESIERSIAAGLDCEHLEVEGDGHHFRA